MTTQVRVFYMPAAIRLQQMEDGRWCASLADEIGAGTSACAGTVSEAVLLLESELLQVAKRKEE